MHIDVLQHEVHKWMKRCFKDDPIAFTSTERNHRFLEEAIELVQACGATKEECLQLIDYVYSRPVGSVPQEIGGVMLTLAALSDSKGIDMDYAARQELTRANLNIDKIREKHNSKPRNSPLPGVSSPMENS